VTPIGRSLPASISTDGLSVRSIRGAKRCGARERKPINPRETIGFAPASDLRPMPLLNPSYFPPNDVIACTSAAVEAIEAAARSQYWRLAIASRGQQAVAMGPDAGANRNYVS
jgi:hypothetical protein